MTRERAISLLGDLYPHRELPTHAERLGVSVGQLKKVVYGERTASPALAAKISDESAGVLSMEMLCGWSFDVPEHARAFERQPLSSRHDMAIADAAATGTDA